MSRTPAPLWADQPSAIEDASGFGDDSANHEGRNFVILALYTITLRTGWIFKTESVVMPAFLDSIAGAGWIRGFLPFFSRLGLSVPPVLYAKRLRSMKRKKVALAGFSLAMASVFLALAVIWSLSGTRGQLLPSVFIGLYGLFFVCTGLTRLAGASIRGKLVRAQRRGRLMMLSTTVGATVAILAAWWLMDDWLASQPPRFDYLFAASGVLFALASILAGRLVERADVPSASDIAPTPIERVAIRVLRQDPSFRRLATVATMFSVAMLLLPHYQALARSRLGLGFDQLMWWVVVQNAGSAVFSLILGPLADRYGNRVVIRLIIFGSALTPIVAVSLAEGPWDGRPWYGLVFCMIGLIPIMSRVLANLTLEMCSTQDQPEYLSTLGLCIATPFAFSPLVGWLVDVTSFRLVLLSGALVIALGGVLTFRLREPRYE